MSGSPRMTRTPKAASLAIELQTVILRRPSSREIYGVLLPVLDLRSYGTVEIDAEVVADIGQKNGNVRKLPLDRGPLVGHQGWDVRVGCPLKALQKLGRLDRQCRGEVLGRVESLPLTFSSKVQQVLETRSVAIIVRARSRPGIDLEVPVEQLPIWLINRPVWQD